MVAECQAAVLVCLRVATMLDPLAVLLSVLKNVDVTTANLALFTEVCDFDIAEPATRGKRKEVL